MPNQPTPDKLDEILEKVRNWEWDENGEVTQYPLLNKDEAKQAILQLYREWAMELIGEDEDEIDHSPEDYGVSYETDGEAVTRNHLRAELRHKLQETK